MTSVLTYKQKQKMQVIEAKTANKSDNAALDKTDADQKTHQKQGTKKICWKNKWQENRLWRNSQHHYYPRHYFCPHYGELRC